MNTDIYWKDIDVRIDELLKNGYTQLPSITEFDLDLASENILREMGTKTFVEASPPHLSFLDTIGVDKYLTPKLFDKAKSCFGYEGSSDDQYNIARKIEPGNSKEHFRAHFDSHLFTMVLPVNIPFAPKDGSAGELITYYNARRFPKSEIENILGKAFFKRYASEKGLRKFSQNHEENISNFRDYRPILFLGPSTLHANKAVSIGCNSARLTLLAHFFDPAPKYGVGRALRLLRNR
mgnify:CR=1 FL=1